MSIPLSRKPPAPDVLPRHAAFEVKAMLQMAGAPDLAARFGFNERLVEDAEAMIPLPQWHAFLEAIVEVTGDDYFGVRFAATTAADPGHHAKPRSTGLIFLAMSSPSMAVALGHLVRYQHLFNEGDRYSLVARGAFTHIRFEPWGPPRHGQVQMAEKTVWQVLAILRQADPAIGPEAIHLGHPERPGSEFLTEAFGLAPRFAAEATEVVVRTQALERPMRDANPDFFRFFDHLLREKRKQTAAHPSEVEGDAPLVTEVRCVISRVLHCGTNTSEEVARNLDTSLRTLQRRLSEHDTSLTALVTEVRQSRACALLAKPMPLREVALLTGYASTPAFLRAFRGWFGVTPNQWRTQQTAATPPNE